MEAIVKSTPQQIVPGLGQRPTVEMDRVNKFLDEVVMSPRTRTAYQNDLELFTRWMAANGHRFLSRAIVEAWKSDEVSRGSSKSSINRRMSALRWYCNQMIVRADDMLEALEYEDNPPPALVEQLERTLTSYGRITRVPLVKQSAAGDEDLRRRGRALNHGEVIRLMATTDEGAPIDRRDNAILAVMFESGIRRAELLDLKVGDVVEDGGRYRIIVRHGKGDKSRTVDITNGAAASLGSWLAIRADVAAGDWLFPAVLRGGHLTDRPLGAQGLVGMIDRRTQAAGLGGRIRPHDARRTVATSLLSAGVNIDIVRNQLGHAQSATTLKYSIGAREERADAIEAHSYIPAPPWAEVAPAA